MSNCLIGVRRCGCITAVQLDGYATAEETQEFYVSMAVTGREVRFMDFEEAKAQPHFLDCPHKAGAVSPAPLTTRGEDSNG